MAALARQCDGLTTPVEQLRHAGRGARAHHARGTEMVNPMIIIPVATAVLGLWVLVTGRPVARWPSRPLGSKLRVWAATDLVLSVAVVGLAMAGNTGLAFLLYAVSALVLALATVRWRTAENPRS
jgi:uncharacterized membrane protein YidH (DUF202 family)